MSHDKAALTFTEEAVNHYAGQTNLVLTALLDNVAVGTIEYVVYHGIPSISMVTVRPEYRRRGVATQMLRQLQRQYPDVEIGGQDNLTDLGAQWSQNIAWQSRPNPRYQELTEEKARLEAEADRLMALFDRGTVPKDQLGQLGDDMNQVHDRLYQIEEEIHGMKPARRIFTGATRVASPAEIDKILKIAERDAVRCGSDVAARSCLARAASQLAARLNGLAGHLGAVCQFNGVRIGFPNGRGGGVGVMVHSAWPHWSWDRSEKVNAVMCQADALEPIWWTSRYTSYGGHVDRTMVSRAQAAEWISAEMAGDQSDEKPAENLLLEMRRQGFPGDENAVVLFGQVEMDLVIVDDTTVEVSLVYVDPRARRQGLAAKAMTLLTAWADHHGCDLVLMVYPMPGHLVSLPFSDPVEPGQQGKAADHATLVKFYQGFGFVSADPGGNDMIRDHRPIKQAGFRGAEPLFDEGFVGNRWGSQGAGLLLTTGEKVLLLLRSDEVEEPGTWGISGGAVRRDSESGDFQDLKQAALQEAREEMGRVPPHRIAGQWVYQEGRFRYTTFVGQVDPAVVDRWEPRLNWESDDYGWFTLEELAGLDLHFGVVALLDARPDLVFGGAV